MEILSNFKTWVFLDTNSDGLVVDVVTDDFMVADNGVIVDKSNWKDLETPKYGERVMAYTVLKNKTVINVRSQPDTFKYAVYINNKKMDMLNTFGQALAKAESYNFFVE